MTWCKIVAGFIKKIFTGLLSSYKTRGFGGSLAFDSEGSINCASLNIQQWCQARPTLVNTYSKETTFYPFTDSVKVFGGSCNTIYDPYAQYVFQIK